MADLRARFMVSSCSNNCKALARSAVTFDTVSIVVVDVPDARISMIRGRDIWRGVEVR